VIETAVAMILSPGPNGPEVLFIRRAEREGDPWSGHIGLPGGRREAGDPDLLATAIRETREEIGVELPPSRLKRELDELKPSTPSLPPILIRPYVFELDERPATRVSDEVTDSFWVPLSSLAGCEGKATVSVKGRTLEVSCFKVPGLPDGLVVWGLTYRILDRYLRAGS
jgi:8-oxo-dGTP pyrophosphatase MutT (NUDIX family)